MSVPKEQKRTRRSLLSAALAGTSSALSVGAVIGLGCLAAYALDVPTEEFTDPAELPIVSQQTTSDKLAGIEAGSFPDAVPSAPNPVLKNETGFGGTSREQGLPSQETIATQSHASQTESTPSDPTAPTGATAVPKPPPDSPLPASTTKNLVPAKQLFGAVQTPARLISRSIGFYAKGCLAGAKALPVNGPAWQAMRLSRNRNWGHPNLVHFVEQFAKDAKAKDGWRGLLIGDMSLPRGGPMPSGHASHQIGLDVDIWYTAMPNRQLSWEDRERTAAANMLADKTHINKEVFTSAHAQLLRRAASYPEVERIFVHPAIKKALCELVGNDRSYLRKIRPFWGHDDHFHIRLVCPTDSVGCIHQPVPADDDGCGAELDNWFKLLTRPEPPPAPPPKEHIPAKPKPQLTLDQLPAACRAVLAAPPSAPEHTVGH
jgi:penicillin-insensitive murein endopeptidase